MFNENDSKQYFTFFDILVFIEGFQRIFFGKSSKSIDKMCAKIWIDILWCKFCIARSINRPICVVTNDSCFFGICNKKISLGIINVEIKKFSIRAASLQIPKDIIKTLHKNGNVLDWKWNTPWISRSGIGSLFIPNLKERNSF